jgi:hypothetical protein
MLAQCLATLDGESSRAHISLQRVPASEHRKVAEHLLETMKAYNARLKL